MRRRGIVVKFLTLELLKSVSKSLLKPESQVVAAAALLALLNADALTGGTFSVEMSFVSYFRDVPGACTAPVAVKIAGWMGLENGKVNRLAVVLVRFVIADTDTDWMLQKSGCGMKTVLRQG